MFKLRILSLFFLVAFAGSKALKQTTNVEPHDEESKLKNHGHRNDVTILLKDDGEIDVNVPNHENFYYIDDEDESDRAPLLMKRGKGKWRNRGYRGSKAWRKYNKYGPNGYGGGYNGYNGPNGPGGGWNNGYDNWG